MQQRNSGKFYAEMEKSKDRPLSCNCLTLSIFFVVILVVLEGGLFIGSRRLRSGLSLEQASNSSNSLNLNLAELDTGGGEFQVSVPQGTLCAKFAGEIGKGRSYQCLINEEGIRIGGHLRTALPANSEVVLTPKVERGQLKFEVKELLIGRLRVPDWAARNLGGVCKKAILAGAPDLKNAEVTGVELREGLMLIRAKKTGE